MIYLPLYVSFEYPDIEQKLKVVFYNIPNSTWYFADSTNSDNIYEHTCKPDSNIEMQMGSPTTYKRTNETIKKALRNTIYRNQMPEKIKSSRCAEFLVSLIDGKKTQRLRLDIETKSKMRVMGNSYLDVVNSDSFNMFHLEIPKYYQYSGNLTACIYDWYVIYRDGNITNLWECGCMSRCRNGFPDKRLMRGGCRYSTWFGGKIYRTGIPKSKMKLENMWVAFEYITPDKHLKRVQINVRPHSISECYEQTIGIHNRYFRNRSFVKYCYSDIPEPMCSGPNEINAKTLVKFVVDRYFETHSE